MYNLSMNSGKAWVSKKWLTIFLALLLLIGAAKLYLNYKYPIPITVDEAENFLVGKTLQQNTSLPEFSQFLNSEGYKFFLINTTYDRLIAHLPLKLFILRGQSVILFFLLATSLLVLIRQLAQDYFENGTFYYFIVYSVLLLPWTNIITMFYPLESVSIIFLNTVLYLTIKKKCKLNKKDVITISLLLLCSSLTSFYGLLTTAVFILVGVIILASNKALNLPIIVAIAIIFILPITALVVKNNGFLQKTLVQETMISELMPQKLAQEINERQKVDFLSSNKQFILPSSVRKFIYNKPALATNKLIQKFISIFDFEQLTFPLISYDILKLSGLLPKGRLPLLYLWDIIFLFTGLFLYLRNKKSAIVLLATLMLFLPAVLLSKREVIISLSIILPFVLWLEYISFSETIHVLNKVPKKTRFVITISGLIFIVLFPIKRGQFLYKNISAYQRSDILLFREISSWLSKNRQSFDKVVITDRFGPTALMTTFYLQLNPDDYWIGNTTENKKTNQITIDNMNFRQINFPDEDKSRNIAYIGFPGEFTKPGGNPEEGVLPNNAYLIKKIESPDELVYQYGKNIWIVGFKN
jgi:hypothetical protein